MNLRHLILSVIACTGLLPSAMAANTPSILSIKDSLHDISVVPPESLETDVKQMQENWYLRTYTELDRQADERPEVATSDQDYIDRLMALPTVIEMPFNSVVKNFIVMYAERKRQLVENMLGMSLYYMPIFDAALERHGLPLELRYLPVIESALNPSAVSRAGAAGLWQFMPGTGTQLGLELNSLVDQRRDPYLSSDAAARYLKQLYNIFGDWSLAIASYNCGPGNVAKAIKRAGGGTKDFWEIYRFLPAETRGYVPAFIAANYVMNNFHHHNISPALARKPLVTDTVHVSRRIHFQQISDVLAIPIDEIRALNPQFRKDLIPGDIHPYSLVLPSLQTFAYIANEDSIANHNAELYARRDVVEPSTGTIGQNANGRYVDEVVVQYHTVRKGETLAKIAKRYGVSAASIRKSNGMGKKAGVKRGQRLKINTIKRRYLPDEPPAETTGVENVAVDGTEVIDPTTNPDVDTPAGDNTEADNAEQPSEIDNELVADNTDMTKQAKAAEPKKAEPKKTEPKKAEPKKTEPKKAEPKKTEPKATTHTVKSGESVARIAKRYGVTPDAILKANGLKSADKIQPGQKLTIPAKGSTAKTSTTKTSTAKKSTSKKSSTKQSSAKKKSTKRR